MHPAIEAALPYLESRGIKAQTAEEYVLTMDVAQNAILIPYFDAQGGLWGVAKRNLDWEKGQKWPPKYEWGGGKRRHLYNIVDAPKNPIYVAEGEFDTLILKQLGLDAVGVPGVNSFRPEWTWLFAGNTVVLCFDADPPIERNGKILRAGQDGMHRVRKQLYRVCDNIRMVQLPEGEDITSMYVAGRINEVL